MHASATWREPQWTGCTDQSPAWLMRGAGQERETVTRRQTQVQMDDTDGSKWTVSSVSLVWIIGCMTWCPGRCLRLLFPCLPLRPLNLVSFSWCFINFDSWTKAVVILLYSLPLFIIPIWHYDGQEMPAVLFCSCRWIRIVNEDTTFR